jgi:hypothetical protein
MSLRHRKHVPLNLGLNHNPLPTERARTNEVKSIVSKEELFRLVRSSGQRLRAMAALSTYISTCHEADVFTLELSPEVK